MRITWLAWRSVFPLMAFLPIIVLPMAWMPKAQAANPCGIRLKVRCYFRVTNAIDGPHDDEVEIYGTVKFNGKAMWNVAREDAFGAVRDLNKKIEVGEQTVDVIYSNRASSVVKFDGFLNDRDQSGGDDAMWNPLKRTVGLDIKQLYDRDARLRPFGLYVSQGDRDRESADLMIVVSKVSDIA